MGKIVLASVFVFLAIMVLVTMIPAALWYTFDDTLAELVGEPRLGRLSFWFVWPVCLFIWVMFKPISSISSSKN